MKIIIVAPSLDVNKKVAGISAVTQFIIDNNETNTYIHFELGTNDNERRNILWAIKMLKTYFNWCYVLLKQKDALVHFNIALCKPSVIRDTPLIMIARLLKKRMIIHMHGGDFLMHRKMPFWMRVLLNSSFSGKNPKVVLSPIEEQALKQQLKINHLVVLPNCVELKYASEFTRQYNKKDKLKLLFLGRISEQKGLQFIYSSLKSLKSKGIEFQFTLAGKGEAEIKYLPMFQELLGDDFEFKGVVLGLEKTKLLKENNVFLLPSFFEGLPMALLEGMSFGQVPIITDVGSVKYIIKDSINGILINKYSAEDITAAIENISSDHNYMMSLSQNARQYIFENFNPRDYISGLNKIYNYE